MKALLYTRVSHDDQVRFGLSLETQLEELTDYCKENNITIKKIYSDEGISGGSLNKRKAFQQMIEDAQSGEIILFTKLDRFSRNLLDANIVVQQLEEKNVSIKAIKEDDIDTSTADGKFIFNLKLSLAEREREKVSERINEVFTQRFKQGYSVSGKVPLGYKKVDKKYQIDPETAPMIKDLFEYYDRHQSIAKTLRWWNEKYPEYHYEYYALKNQRLMNTIYIGKHPSGLNDHFCEPIVDEELFNRVQLKIKANISERKKTQHVFIFSKLIRCGVCGRRMVGNYTCGKYIYRCNHAYQNNVCSNRHTTYEPKLERFMVQELKNMINGTDIHIKLQPKISPEENFDMKKQKLLEKVDRLKDLYVDGIINRDEFDSKYQSFMSQIDSLSNESKVPVETIKVLEEFNHADFDSIYDQLTREYKQMFWHRFVQEIVIDETGYKVVYF